MKNNFTPTPTIESVLNEMNPKMPSSIRQTKHYLKLVKAFRLTISTSAKPEHYTRHFFVFLNAVSQGNSQALYLLKDDALCLLYHWIQNICHKAYRAEWSGYDRDDLISEFLEKKLFVQYMFGSYSPKFAVETFMSNCFRNYCIDSHRRKSILKIVFVDSNNLLTNDTFEDIIDKQVFDGDVLSIMGLWVKRNHPAYVQIYEMHYVRMMKASEMASIIGISVNATYQRIDQLKRHLKTFGSRFNAA